MSAQTADFAVLRNGANWRCSGSNLKTRLLSTDKVVITRGSTTGLCDPFEVEPTDWLAATDTDGETYKVAGSKFLELITPDAPAAGQSLFHILKPDNTGSIRCSEFTKLTDIDGNVLATNISGNASHNITAAGQYLIYGPQCRFDNSTANWDFGRFSGTSNLTSMFRFVADCTEFSGDVSWFDTSNVTDMHDAFAGATKFNNDLSGWDTSSVTTMQAMFSSVKLFNSDISGWDVSSVTNMDFMFDTRYTGVMAFNQDLSGWCVSNIGSYPTRFAELLAPAKLPVWGTCP